MSRFDAVVSAITDHSRAAIAVMLVLTIAIGAGAPMVERSSSLDQFQTDSVESQKLDYIEANFSTGAANTTSAQIIIRDENVLDKESLLESLRYQRALRQNQTVSETLTNETPTVGVANILATAAITQEAGRDLQTTAAKVQRLNATVTAERAAIQNRSDALNATAEDLRAALTYLRQNPDASVRTQFDQVRANTTVTLNESDYATFERAAEQLRGASTQAEAEQAYTLGTRGVLSEEYAAVQERAAALREKVDRLQRLAEELEADRAAFRNASEATLAEQIDQIRSMNASEIDSTITAVLGSGDGSGSSAASSAALAFMPTSYDPGATEANATMLLVTQVSDGGGTGGASASEPVIDAQLAMQDIARDRDTGHEYMVFGAGIISHELTSSMTDSLLIVGPLAVLFVLVALAVAYRDPLDIILGLLGIGAVLVWTFGFMGWADIDFNQIFIAVPVLLIGLSIDYAIHIFMRHREERTAAESVEDAPSDPRGSMRVALAGVGIALVWVTATTVIGFLSNLTSPVPPIRDFGVVSSVGIVAALLVFGVLVPALKVEFDEFLEARGVDRTLQAFGTGGGAFSRVLRVGAVGAKKAPYLVLIVAVLLSAGGAYGATQVDTSFSQSDFLAEDPPGWMEDLPEPFAPSEYSAKENLQYVNEHFIREDSQAQILIEGDVTAPGMLERIESAHDLAAEKRVTQELPNGEPDITSPVSVIRQVAAQNESFNSTVAAADTDGDGIPDRNLERVYDRLYEVAPEQAESVIYRNDGEYVAARMVISVEGGASGDAVTTQMRDVAESLEGDDVTVTATGSAILNQIVQDELLETVVNSLIITLVATFLFLMVAYRLANGSATLGAVTLLPVAFSVAWILGTMYLMDIPFNVLTGMITSLTVGLGVAYSIHLSERYTQELERTRDVWTAMHRAVTGTGGALLGSAATTVGGFGVLVFAILPPLQQFGVITGLTIIYAFLASVLVLPSLLVIWTRFAGPDWAAEAVANDDGPGGSGGSGGADEAGGDAGPDGSDVAAEAVAAPSTADAIEPDAHTAEPAAAEDEFAEADFVPAAVVDADARVVRVVDREYVAPGDDVQVTVRASGVADRVVLHEEFDGDVALDEATPEPVDVVERDGELYVAWDATDGVALQYDAAVPADADDGASFGFDGALMAADGDRPVGGADAVSVVEDLFERVLAAGTVTDDDLRGARERFEDGAISDAQFERIHRAWIRGDQRTTDELPAGDDN
ncbi:MMPL family transporter [Halobaculum sp. P14]|uniref:MMPL family transporter n=1 Tax=Halobaculum sp. P14 TaxID=3421638 RepID=UPI003EBDA5D8